LGTVTPDDLVGLGERGDFADPLLEFFVLDVGGRGGDRGLSNALGHLTILQRYGSVNALLPEGETSGWVFASSGLGRTARYYWRQWGLTLKNLA
jgi:hypothetical protein